MPRTLQRASQTYLAGTYGPFSVDGFNRGNVDRLRVGFTVENWPDVPEAIRVRVVWNNGQGAEFSFPGRPVGRSGALPAVWAEIDVPNDAAGKKEVLQGEVTVRLFAALRTAITIQAL